MSIYVVAGRDLEPFVNRWLVDVELGSREESILAAAIEAEKDGGFESEYLFNATYLYSQIGSRAVEADASDEELLLAAVLATYQHANDLWRGMRWVSRAEHVARAFQFAHETGDASMARLLIDEVLSREDSEGWRRVQRSNAETNPAKAAYWDGKMTDLAQRELRAAAIFDPTVDFDSILLDPNRP